MREFNWDRTQWNLHFSTARLGDASPPKIGWQRALSTLRLRWETRAAYYLGDETLAMFLPLTLAERSVRHSSLEFSEKQEWLMSWQLVDYILAYSTLDFYGSAD